MCSRHLQLIIYTLSIHMINIRNIRIQYPKCHQFHIEVLIHHVGWHVDYIDSKRFGDIGEREYHKLVAIMVLSIFNVEI